jgi:outer membrane receptor protein involved in Fe transport
MRFSRLASVAAALIASTVVAASARSQSPSAPAAVGIVSGRVLDRSGDPVEFASVDLLGLSRGTQTDLNGRFVLRDVPAGPVTLKVRRSGLVPIEHSLQVIAGGTVDVQLVAREDVFKLETIEVRATPKIDVKSVEVEHALPGERIRDTAGIQTVTDAVETVSGVVSHAGGLSVHGGRTDENKMLVSGIQAVDENGGRSGEVSILAVENVQVRSGVLTAEFGNSLSSIIDVTTREGADSLAGDVRWDTDRYGDPTKTYDRFDRVGIDVSGPTPIRHLTFFGVWEGTFTDTYLHSSARQSTRTVLDFIQLGSRQFNKTNASVKLAWRPNGRHKLTFEGLQSRTINTPYEHMWSREGFVQVLPETVSTAGEPVATAPRYGTWSAVQEDSTFVPMNLPDHVPSLDDRFHQFTLTWTDQLSGTTVVTSRLAALGFSTRQSVGLKEPWEYDTEAPAYWNGNLEPGTEMNPYFATHGDFPRWVDRSSGSYTFKTDVTTQRTHHLAKAGVEARRTHIENLSLTLPNIESNGLPGGNRSQFVNDSPEGSAYLQDRWDFEGLVLSAGVRYDVFSPGAGIPMSDLPSGERVKQQVSPRLGVAYPISDRDALSFNYGWTYQTPPRNFIFENRGPGATVNVRGNPDLKPETDVAYQGAVQHLFSRDVSGQFSVFFRDIYGLITARQQDDGFGNVVAVYTNGDYASARGFEASLSKSFSHKFSAEVNYTLSLASGVASDPNQSLQFFNGGQLYLPISERPLDWDQRHTLSIASTVRDPGRWGIRMLWTYGSGLPFTPSFRNDRRPDPKLDNTRRLPSRSTLNVDLDKYARVWGQNLTLYVDARNVLNAVNIANLSPNDAAFLNPNVNVTGDDYTTYYTETGRAGGGYLSDRNNDGVAEWVPLHDPRVVEEGRAVRLGMAVSF